MHYVLSFIWVMDTLGYLSLNIAQLGFFFFLVLFLSACTWRSEDTSQSLALSIHHVGPRELWWTDLEVPLAAEPSCWPISVVYLYIVSHFSMLQLKFPVTGLPLFSYLATLLLPYRGAQADLLVFLITTEIWSFCLPGRPSHKIKRYLQQSTNMCRPFEQRNPRQKQRPECHIEGFAGSALSSTSLAMILTN